MEPEPYRCALALAVARNMDAIAADTLAGWQAADGWVPLIENPGPDNPVYRTHKEAVTEIHKAILTGLEQARDQRLVAALGAKPEQAKASRAPYNTSGRAIAYLEASAEALEALTNASGILGLVPQQPWIAGSAAFEFGNLKRTLAASGDDLEAALADPKARSKLGYAAVVLASLRDLLQRQLGPFAGLTAGFNSLDGD
jgi:predicted lipoprotein